MFLDRVGIGMSVACAVHCAALPLIAGAALFSHNHDHALHAPWLDAVMVGVAASIGYATLGYGFRRHRNLLPLVILTIGLVLIVAGHVLFAQQSGVIAVAGALLLVLAQIQNRRCPAPCCASGTCVGATPRRT